MLKTSRLHEAMLQEFESLDLSAHPPHRMQQQTFDAEGQILPRKVINPCMESKEVQDLNREIKWNARTGTKVVGTKSELAQAMEKRKWQQREMDKKTEKEANKTDFQKVLEQRARRIEHLDKPEDSGDSGHCSPEPESEFLKVHKQLKKNKH